jgi:8-oxo-dGTP pyrophosphatase MutT (NUDIX family)
MSEEGTPEQVDVIDENDVVVGQVTRAEMRRRVLRHRAVFAAVVSSEGKLLIHRRSDSKDIWPGWWDIAVGGVVTAGETYDSAMVRELAEEAGIDDATLHPLGKGSYVDADVSLIGQCFLVHHDGPVEARDGEVAEMCWVSAAELRDRLERAEFLPDSRALLLPGLFEHLR